MIVTIAPGGWGQTSASAPGNLSSLPAPERSLDPEGTRPRLDSMSSVEEDDYDTLTDIDSDKNVIRTKVCTMQAHGRASQGRETQCPGPSVPPSGVAP